MITFEIKWSTFLVILAKNSFSDPLVRGLKNCQLKHFQKKKASVTLKCRIFTIWKSTYLGKCNLCILLAVKMSRKIAFLSFFKWSFQSLCARTNSVRIDLAICKAHTSQILEKNERREKRKISFHTLKCFWTFFTVNCYKMSLTVLKLLTKVWDILGQSYNEIIYVQ